MVKGGDDKATEFGIRLFESGYVVSYWWWLAHLFLRDVFIDPRAIIFQQNFES